MTKSKDKNEVEYLRGLVKQLKSENRNLKKQVGRSEKRKAIVDQMEQDAQEHLMEIETERVEIKEKDSCPDCGKSVDKTDLGVRWLIMCDHCGFRRSIKKK